MKNPHIKAVIQTLLPALNYRLHPFILLVIHKELPVIWIIRIQKTLKSEFLWI